MVNMGKKSLIEEKTYSDYTEDIRKVKVLIHFKVDRLMEKQLQLLYHKSKKAKLSELKGISNVMIKIADFLLKF